MKKVSKATKLLNQIKKTPLKYKEMQQFIYTLNGNKGKVLNGYWCDGFSILIRNEVIVKNPKTKRYYLTEIGRLNIDKPFTSRDRQRLSMRAKLFRANQKIERIEHNYDWLHKKYREMRAIVVDSREYVNMRTKGVY